MRNPDEALLRNRRLDTRAPFPPLHQALRIALHDAYAARAFHAGVVEAFGAQPPFADALRWAQQRIAALGSMCERYGVARPLDTAPRGTVEPGWRANCRRAVAGQLESARTLAALAQAVPQPDVRRLLHRLQADALRRQLPALKHAAQEAADRERYHASIGVPPSQAYARHGPFTDFVERVLAQVGGGAGALGLLTPVLRHAHPALLAGVAAGAAGVVAMRRRTTPTRNSED